MILLRNYMNCLVLRGAHSPSPQKKVRITTEKPHPIRPSNAETSGRVRQISFCREASWKQEGSSNWDLYILLRKNKKFLSVVQMPKTEGWSPPAEPMCCPVEEHGMFTTVLGSKVDYDTQCVCNLNCLLCYLQLCRGLDCVPSQNSCVEASPTVPQNVMIGSFQWLLKGGFISNGVL